MSRLGQVSSTRNVLPGLHNGFGGDPDDDDLSLDGIYDDDQDIRVPGAFNKVSDTKGEPVASTGSAFNAQIPGGSVPNRRPLVTPNSTRPQNPLVGAPVTHNEPPRRYYTGVDVCIVRGLPSSSMFPVAFYRYVKPGPRTREMVKATQLAV